MPQKPPFDPIIQRVAAHLREQRVEVWPAASADAIRAAEESLGFAIPPLLTALYLKVGNGWSAPGYGLIGVAGGRSSGLGDLVGTYREVLRGANYLQLDWPTSLLPFCEWGCNIFSCVDCQHDAAPVHRSEECETSAEGYFLADFLTMWLDGINLLDLSQGKGVTKEVVNPFTRKKSRVAGFRKAQ